MTMSRPLIVVPTVHRVAEIEEEAFIQGLFRARIRWTKPVPTVHRMKRNGERARRRNGEGEFNFSGSPFPRFAPSARGGWTPSPDGGEGLFCKKNSRKTHKTLPANTPF